ncbi:hypothetical protein Tco_0974896 [Tanacetum coccineum]|uniref:Secreted protein n=1 Tax=Tanacetum coccineum TaxID=301880 RepID=A0ABQ5ECT3_9ASTR
MAALLSSELVHAIRAYTASLSIAKVVRWCCSLERANSDKDEKTTPKQQRTGLGMEKTVKTKQIKAEKSTKSTEKSTGQRQSQPKSTPRPKVKEI